MYFVTPNYSVALNPKVASTTLARAIIAAFYPELEAKIQANNFPRALRTRPAAVFHSLCPQEVQPTRPILLVVRDPVDRFRSAMAQLSLTDVESVLIALETNANWQLKAPQKLTADPHFLRQHRLAGFGARVFRLENLDAAAELIGLSLPLLRINDARREKPVVSEPQAARILALYPRDKALYDATPPTGLDYVPAN